jgi:hypothetical protein
VSLADILREVSADLARLERGALAPVGFTRGTPVATASTPAAVATLVSVPAAPEPAPPAPVAHVGLLSVAGRPVAAA